MAKGGKKKKQKLIPKQVGGVKIPKGVRQTGEKVLRAAEANPLLADLAAAALLAAAAALDDKGSRVKKLVKEPEGDGEGARRISGPHPLKLAALEAVRQLAQAYEESRGGSGAAKR